jgi:hypothetical protein
MATKRKPKAAARDWAALHDAIERGSRECAKRTGIDFDEHYVVALQKAIDGRDDRDLLQLLDEGRAIPPPLGPTFAEYLRAGKAGTPPRLTFVDDGFIRRWFDGSVVRNGRRVPGIVKAELAQTLNVSVDVIEDSLRRTAKSGVFER